MFESGVGSKDGVVRLNDGSRHLRRWIDGKLKFGLLSIINGQPDTWWGGRKAEERKGKSGGRDRRREGKEGGEKGGKGKKRIDMRQERVQRNEGNVMEGKE